MSALLQSLSQFSQRQLMKFTPEEIGGINRAANMLMDATAQLRPYLDLAISKPFPALLQLSNRIVSTHGEASVTQVSALCSAIDAVQRSVSALKPVLCPHLIERMDADLLRLNNASKNSFLFLQQCQATHERAVLSALPPCTLGGVGWNVDFVDSPCYFTTALPELATIRQIRLGKKTDAMISIAVEKPFQTVADLLHLLNEVAATSNVMAVSLSSTEPDQLCVLIS